MLQKVIELIIRDSKVSMKKYIKNFKQIEKFCGEVQNLLYYVINCYGKKHLRNDSFVENILKF